MAIQAIRHFFRMCRLVSRHAQHIWQLSFMANPIFRLCGRHAEVEFGERVVSIVDFDTGGVELCALACAGFGSMRGGAVEGVKGTTDY